MIVLYTSPGCASCRKAKQWLKDNNLDYKEKNMFTSILKEDEIKYLLSRSENGTSDLISTRSKIFQELKIDVDDLSVNELVDLIQDNPSILRRPIMIDEKNIVVGYDDDEITALMPRALRDAVTRACNPKCQMFEICGSTREK